MPGTTTGKKLDLSKLTDEEAKHVWEVVQRDFDLRKKEEDRLGELKTKIEKEDTKRELLGNQTSVTESLCIRCLQPFKFLVNSKRQCLDCQLYICKSCSRYNKKEHGWVCDPCRMARVLKIGTLEWYHENVRARFKRFGSAKVMRSLFKRLSGEHSCTQSDLGEPHEYDTQSMPDVHVHNGYEEHSMDATDSQQGIKKAKRRLTVDPFDFGLGCDYAVDSRRQSNQAPGSNDSMVMDVAVRESMLAEADMASVFHQILEEQRKDDLVYSDSRTVPSRSVSQLSYSSCGSGSAGGPRGSSSYLPGPDDSEEEHDHFQPYPLYQSHPGLCSHMSQESLNSANPPPQITDLNRRMSAIETFLNRLEHKVTSTYDQASPNSSSPLPQWEEVDLEEQQLRQKLHEMTDNISDHSLTSDDEDEPSRPHSSQEIPAWRSPEGDTKPSRLPTRPTSRTSIVVSRLEEEQLHQTDSQKMNDTTESVEWKWHPLEEGSKASFRGSTALLVELEDQVAQAAANVQNAQSEVSYIENRIAALNAAGMPVDKRRKSAIPIQARRLSQNFPTNQVDRFARNSLYRGSLTQRNPVATPKTRATCAKPVMTQGS
ncbi:melanophilin-like isoform X2 [Seriola lalandi dorsalis]|uniref:melanophilin-like isoform X2 n=1 Tax=Seriola lalandi dorsalis TaxID=1841481 RepID=UPI000C6F50D0|nr:melanophilin-like isoform X2 [Seriola lalandi dorsalis]XP_056246205.1 melanophilin isoform X2 [Seriola aureovittata]